MLEAPEIIKDLVEKFERNLKSYKSPRYNEAQVRQEFINPFFKALGWDVDNESNAAPPYRDVIFEDSIKVAGGTRAPDYCFTLSGRRMFFVEAKKPSSNLKENKSHAYQLRRYAWSAKLSLSILTDFEEFSVYEPRKAPKKTDKASNERVLYYTYKDYVEKWDEISSIFSYESVRNGSFDRYVEETKKKRGTQEVDDAFLSEIESWRELFAKNIALRNKELTIEELNYAVQKVIDRIIFLRMGEDRGLEKYGRLKKLLETDDIYKSFCELCKDADIKYNSGLFYFSEEKGRDTHPDQLTLNLNIDNKVLNIIIKGLYYPDSPYEFSVLSPEILGNVYEQFLGKKIRLTPSHMAKVEEKPEVKKAGGIYYTPQFIVNYIVENTVGRLCNGLTPNKVAELRILDPACGSGSFLLGAYDYLLKWHLNYYINLKDKKRLKGNIYEGKDKEWHLTIQEKKKILLNNIYGVDIDTQAVEVTKLSLLLKVLEGESKDVLEAQQKLFKERALPDLGYNIKCGNSLIEPDIYENHELVLTEDDIQRINPFNWKSEFSKIMEDGGFDTVIGNPPYIRVQRIGHTESDYIYGKYETPTSKTDLSLIFIEQSLNLLQNTGLISFICTSQWLSTDYGKNLRKLLSDGKLHLIVDFGSLPVFKKASTYPAIVFISKQLVKSIDLKKITEISKLNIKGIKDAETIKIPVNTLSEAPWNLGGINIPQILKKRSISSEPLKSFGHAYISIITGMDKAFIVDSEIINQNNLETSIIYPYAYQGKEIHRYSVVKPAKFVIYPYNENSGKVKLISNNELKNKYPNVYQYLLSFKDDLRKRKDSRKFYASGNNWYCHVRPGSFDHIKPKKLIIKGISKKSTLGLLEENMAFSGANCPGIILDNLQKHSLFYILGLLNSKLISYYLKLVCPSKLSGYTRFNATNINKTPIRVINFDSSEDITIHDTLVKLVKQILKLHEILIDSKTPDRKHRIQRQIDATDYQIDVLVYELYGLTDDEIRIVEDSLKN